MEEDEKLKSTERRNGVYKCGGCEFQTEIQAEFEDHYMNKHGVGVGPDEAALYLYPDDSRNTKDDRIIGLMASELSQSGINLGPYEIIESDLKTFGEMISNLQKWQKVKCRYV